MKSQKEVAGISLSVVVAGGMAVFLIMTIMVVGMPSMFYTGTPTTRAHEYTALEAKGRALYVSLGCFYCHSQQVRPEDWGLGNVSKSGDFSFDLPHTLGTERTGPDLSQIGGQRPTIWHYLHDRDPRSVSPGSIMPSFAFLSDEDIDAIIAYIQYEGGRNMEPSAFQTGVPVDYVGMENPYTSLIISVMNSYNADNQTYYGDATLGAEYAAIFQLGKTIFTQRCISCHGCSGNGQGPYARHVVTRPANLHERIMNYPPEQNASFHFWRVSEGVPGTAMPSWKLSLNETERWEVITYELSFVNGSTRTISGDISDAEGDAFGNSTHITPPIAGTQEDFEQGKQIFLLFCAQCHGDGGQGDGPASIVTLGGYINPQPANFTESGEDFALFGNYGRYVWKVTEGVETTNMPPWKNALTDDEIYKVIFYIQAFAPAEDYNAVWGPQYTDPFARNLKGGVTAASFTTPTVDIISAISVAFISLQIFLKTNPASVKFSRRKKGCVSWKKK